MASNPYHKHCNEGVARGEAAWLEWVGKPPYGAWAVGNEAPIMTMAKPLIIINGVTGAYLTKLDNPNQPISPRELADAYIESYKQGAAVLHLHLKHPEDGTPCGHPETFKWTIDQVLQQCPDAIMNIIPFVDRSAEDHLDSMRPLMEELMAYGPQYADTGMVHASTLNYPNGKAFVAVPKTIAASAKYLSDLGVKPQYECWSIGAAQMVYKLIQDEQLDKPPYLINIDFGKEASAMHGDIPENWDLEELMTWIRALPKSEDVLNGLWAGGRNWLPLTTLAIMMGIDVVGVGMEDAMYMYPHKDDMIESNAQIVRAVADIARMLGREVATPQQAREIMGLPQKAEK